MSSLIFVVLATIFFPSPSTCHVTIPNHDLDTIYDTIIHHQQAANIKNAVDMPYPSKFLGWSALAEILQRKNNFENGISIDLISQVYTQLDGKEKYPNPPAYMFKNINFDALNLTVFHLYEDVNQIGKKLPLLFANQGPPSAILLKRSQPILLKENHIMCESAISGEPDACVSSLEEMLEFVKERMGDSVKPVLALPGKWQEYTVVGTTKDITHHVTGCHKVKFTPFAIYKCHNVPSTVARVVPLLGDDGMKLEAITICHMNTSSWNPNFISFRLLKAKPGVPMCHFVATDDIVWMTNSPAATKNL